MDDVIEALTAPVPNAVTVLRTAEPSTAETGWFVSVCGSKLPGGIDIADLLASYGVLPADARQTQARDASAP